jgi:hypothetical protein
MYAANGPSINWNSGGFRVALVITPAISKVEGDGATYGIYTPNNYDGILDANEGQPAGTAEDYPGYSGLREVLLEEGVYPIFGYFDCHTAIQCSQSSTTAVTTVAAFYQNLVTSLGFGQSINLSAAFLGGSLTSLLTDSLTTALSFRTRFTFGDTYNRLGQISGLDYSFLVSSNSEGIGEESTIGVRDFGVPSPYLFKTTTVPIARGCDGEYNGPAVDECGVCGGDNSCIGCNGLTDSLEFDSCGVCGGDNSSCTGCDGEVLSGKVYDVCGVCGGNGTSCIGCDGVVNSGLTNNSCGTCGSEYLCNGNFHPLGIAGIVLIIVGIISFVLLMIAVTAAKSSLDHKLQALKKDQLFTESRQRYRLQKGK